MDVDIHNRPVSVLLKEVLRARHGRGREGITKHPSALMLFAKMPEDLRSWYAQVISEDPLALLCAPSDPTRDDQYFEIWRILRDRHGGGGGGGD